MIFTASTTAIQRERQYVTERMMYTSVVIQHIPETQMTLGRTMV
jgi:hypothetical protein